MKLSTVLFLLFSTGCGSSSLVYVDERFTPEEEQMIQDAAEVWPVQIDLVFGQRVTAYDTDRRTIVKTDLHVIRHVLNEYDRECSGVTIDHQHTLIAMDMTGPNHLVNVVAHELGHQLNVGHVEDTTAIMYRQSTAETRACISSADAAAYRAANGGEIPVTCPVRETE